MKRNNSNRLGEFDTTQGAPSADADAAIAAASNDVQSGNLSDLSFVSGVDIVEIPSKGFLYPEGHPMHGRSTVEMRHMTAKEEDILTNPALIKNGTALDRVLNSLIVEPKMDTDSLIIGDKNALLLAARISAYGEEYNAKVTCPVCASNQTYEFDLGEIQPGALDELTMAIEGAELTQNKTVLIRTPKTNLLFELRPMLGADEKELDKQAKKYKKLKIPTTVGLTDNFANLTVSINGENDPVQVRRVYENLPAYDFRFLRKMYQRCMPSVDLLSDFTCTECGAEEVISVPLNATFFWPDARIQ